jgi:O-antigen/teichoic acid export membrane protein
VAAGPLIVPTLDLSVEVVALFAAMTLAFVLAAGWLGELQGDQRFVRLAAGMAILALGRYAGVIGGLVFGAGLTGSLLAGVVTSYAALPILLWIARAGADPERRPHVPREAELGLRSVLTAGVATLAMLVVSYADLILARLLLSAEDSGAYSVGTVLTKGAIWAPQIVTVLALPRMARRDRNTLTVTLAVVGACGLVLFAASAVAGELAFRLAGGPAYAPLGGYAPFFAATGALYAVLFVLVNAQIATGARWPSAPLWAAMVGLVVVAVFLAPRTVPGIMWTALATAMAATLTMGARSLIRPGARSDRGSRRSVDGPSDEHRRAREIAA